MTSWIGRGVIFAGAVVLSTQAIAQQDTAQTANRVATKSDWSVFTADKPKECWGVSSPKSSENTRGGKPATVSRGDILFFVTFRPGGGANGEISFTGGYTFDPKSTATLELNGTKYELFTDGQWAWPHTPADDSGLLAALKNGAEATITAHSARGTQTKDTFSLIGFTAAMDEAQKRCAEK
ncbi:MAG: hypothetical protein GC186_00470 [Rhodobacteraceae bacterium]|nr:hypothetical protein [Paracoccaceae bacterium]